MTTQEITLRFRNNSEEYVNPTREELFKIWDEVFKILQIENPNLEESLDISIAFTGRE